MSDITVSVQEIDVFTNVQVQESDLVNVAASIYNPTVLQSISDIGNVDTSNLVNGSVLVYKTQTNKWTSTTLLDLQTMEGGEY